MKNEETDHDHGGTSLTEGVSVSVLVHAGQLPHDALEDAIRHVCHLGSRRMSMKLNERLAWLGGMEFALSKMREQLMPASFFTPEAK